MGLLRTTLLTGALTGLGSAAGVGATMAYILSSSKVVKLTQKDPMLSDKTYARYNPRGIPPLADIVIKRVPLSKIKPELRNDDEALTLEFCRGVWSRWGKSPIVGNKGRLLPVPDELLTVGDRILAPEQVPAKVRPPRQHGRQLVGHQGPCRGQV